MGYDLREDRLSFVPECVIRSVVSMRSKFERFGELPFEVDRQFDRYLVTGKAKIRSFNVMNRCMKIRKTYMSLVGISNWFSPNVKRPRRVTLGLVITDWPAPRSSKSSPRCSIAQLLAGMFKLCAEEFQMNISLGR